MAAPTFFGKGALADEASGSTIGISPQITFPASIAANDIAVMAVGCNGSSTFTTPGGGWAILGTSLESDAGQSTEWYWLRLTGSETAQTVTASATFSSTLGGYGQIWVFRGCITSGNPFEGVGNDGTASQTTPDSTACTTTGPDRLVVCITQLDNDTAFASGYPPGGWTDRGSDASTTGADWRNYCMDRTEASATTVASAVVGTLGSSTRYRTITFALIPVPAGVTGTATGAFGFTGSAAGQPKTLGTATGSFGFEGNASGIVSAPDVTGTATGAFGFTGSAAGQPKTLGTASGSFGFEGNASGQPRTLGIATGSFGFTGSATGQPRTLGTATGAFGFEGNASGFVGAPTVTGTATGSFGFTGSAIGQPRTLGTASGTFDFIGSAAGQPRTLGTATGAFGFIGAAAGTTATIGEVFTGTVRITIRSGA